MTIVFNQDDNDFDDFLSLCDDNYYIMTFVLKKFGIPDMRPSYIFKNIEDRNIPPLIEGIRKSFEIDYQVLKAYKANFNCVSQYDDYLLYKMIWKNLEDIEFQQKKHDEEVNGFKKRIKELTKYIKKRSLIF